MARPLSVVIDCRDPKSLAEFWAPALGYSDSGWPHEPYIVLAGERGSKAPFLILQKVDESKDGKNRVHIDLYAKDVASEADRLVGLGAAHLKGPVEEHGASWIVMADPEGNEFCVVLDMT